MNKILVLLVLCAALISTACGASDSGTAMVDSIAALGSSSDKGDAVSDSDSSSSVQAADAVSYDDVDIDLTKLDSNMVYAQVYDMMSDGSNYMGKTVKAKGQFAYYKDEKTGKEYFAVLVRDAMACCSQGIEFVLSGEYKYPEDYPELDKEITVVGRFDQYEEDKVTYCQLLDAEITDIQGG